MTTGPSAGEAFPRPVPRKVSPRRRSLQTLSSTALASSIVFWFVATVIGQLVFVSYVAAVYGGAVVQGDLAGWNRVMKYGYVAGDTVGNLAIGMHLLLAAMIMLGGALQLIPRLRACAPRFHRWNGRVYLAGAALASLTGLYMIWIRGAVGDVVQHIGISINGILILVFAGMALRRAIARDFPSHRRWALRLFLAVSGVWFFRIGLMFWLAVNNGPAGFDPRTFQGPFLSFLAFAQYLVPLAVLELYLRCREHGGVAARFGMAVLMVVLTLATGVGVAVATMGMWLPRM